MRIIRFRIEDRPTYGVMNEGESRIVGIKGDPLFSQIEPSGQIYQLDQIVPLAPVIPRSKLVIARPDQAQPLGFDFTIKPNTSVVGPQDPVMVPTWASQVTVETMLGVVVKNLLKQVKLAEAESLIAGYTVVNNFLADDNLLWDTSCPLGPWISIDSDFDPDNWSATVQIDGQMGHPEADQAQEVTDAVHPLDALVACSQVMTLLPGDLVLVGATTPVKIPVAIGQTVTAQIGGIGELDNRVFSAQDQC